MTSELAALRIQATIDTKALAEHRATIERLNQVITRVLVLIAPETQMAQPLYGDRYFREADIRNALSHW